MQASPNLLSSHHVAVIGAGAAGLVAARELHREGHKVVVFEKDDQVGGLWMYDPRVEPDPLGLDLTRPVVHSSLYESLRTNLPRETMGFMDYPFVTREGEGRDPRRFPGHREVLMYLQDYAREFGIEEMVRFGCEVVNVEMIDSGKWKVKSKRKRLDDNDRGDDFADHEDFDAVVVCVGHYTQPRIAEIPGINLWPGKQIHSHNYRIPEPFRDQIIILIGASASAADISVEIAGLAKEVHIARRSAVDDDTYEKKPGYDNIWLHSTIERACEDGTVIFRDGSVILADVILHCTGYKYGFPFLKTDGIVTVDDNRVGPLYKHVFPPILAPWLSFVGIPYWTFPFPTFEVQSKWIAGVLSGRIALPSQEDMVEDVKIYYSELEASGVPKNHTHNLAHSTNDYNMWLASQCQCSCFEEWRIEMSHEILKNWRARPNMYRDEWDDDHLILQAHEDFNRRISNKASNGHI
uniref:Flavin-containing monooxygenase n=1 Tax=Populus trichocarpa TaxID=3694 RepID=A0A2K1XZN7_POPTR|eukprot:XP_002319003.3 flavin-containing monooxygenase FMO GS-OX-like 4 [Populus trichocarpa]